MATLKKIKKKYKWLVTGAAGFIGSNLVRYLLENNQTVIAIDNFSTGKKDNISKFPKKLRKNFKFFQYDIRNFKQCLKVTKNVNFVLHNAALGSVPRSIKNPKKTHDTNINGFLNILEASRINKVKKLVFASSSSVYGDSKNFPLKENDKLYPKNIYATSKVINEITAKSFSKNYNMKIFGLRFFTVYGEWGRPDMLLFKIFKNSLINKKLELNNNGNHYRDFTYINDVVEILYLLMNKKLKKSFDIFNICSNNPQSIKKIIHKFRDKISNLKIKNVPKNKLDVFKTHGDNKKINKLLKYRTYTNFDEGFKRTFSWYKSINKKSVF